MGLLALATLILVTPSHAQPPPPNTQEAPTERNEEVLGDSTGDSPLPEAPQPEPQTPPVGEATRPTSSTGTDIHTTSSSTPNVRSYEVEGRLVGDVLEVDARLTVDLGDGGVERLRLWVYGDRLSEVPAVMNQRNARWIFPREVDLSRIEGLTVTFDDAPIPHHWVRHLEGGLQARSAAGSELWIRPGERRGEGVLRIRYRQSLPERFGRMGQVGGRVTLGGPWYPLWLEEDPHGERRSHRLRRPHQVRLCTTRDLEFAGDVALSADGETRCATASVDGNYAPFFLAPSWHRYPIDVDGHQVVLWSHRALYTPPPEDAPGLAGLRDIVRIDVVGDVRKVVGDALATLTATGIPPREGPMHLVLTPSRTELAGSAPDAVVASDRLFEIFPHPVSRSLHERALIRAIFRWHLAPAVDETEAPWDRDWSLDLRAVLLTDRNNERMAEDAPDARELVGWVGFFPAIDQLLYAPQVAFTDVLFGVVAEPDPYRDAPPRARMPMARGRRLLEHARDRLSEDAFSDWQEALLSPETSARHALRRLSPDTHIDEWVTAPAAPLNYRLGQVSTEEVEGRYVHRIEVFRDGATRHEPVTVAVTDVDDEVHTVTWDEAGTHGTVEVITDRPRQSVQLDPQRRLPQSAALAGAHPLSDDGDTFRLKPPILQGINIAVGSDGVVGLLDIAIRRQYDLDNTVGLRLTTSPRAHGGLLRYARGVGRKRDTNVRVGQLSIGVQVDRLRGSFIEGQEGAWRTGLRMGSVFSNQRFFIDPRSGSVFLGSVLASVVRSDDGSVSYSITPTVRGNLTLPLGLRGALVLVAGGSYVFGTPISSELPGLGGRFYLRGYEADELVGRGVGFVVGELRFTPRFLSDLNLNAVHVAWLREVQLALFGGAGVVVSPRGDSDDVAAGAEVGGGVRFHFDWAGVQPGILVVDLAIPLIRDAETRRGRNGFRFFLAFEQFF